MNNKFVCLDLKKHTNKQTPKSSKFKFEKDFRDYPGDDLEAWR